MKQIFLLSIACYASAVIKRDNGFFTLIVVRIAESTKTLEPLSIYMLPLATVSWLPPVEYIAREQEASSALLSETASFETFHTPAPSTTAISISVTSPLFYLGPPTTTTRSVPTHSASLSAAAIMNSAIFLNDGSGITVTFSKAIKVVAGNTISSNTSIACSSFFNITGDFNDLQGNLSQNCQLFQPTFATLLLTLSPTFTATGKAIGVGSSLELLGDHIYDAYAASYSSSGIISVTAPGNPESPRFSATLPTNVSSCAGVDIVIVAVGNANRAWSFASITSNTAGVNLTSILHMASHDLTNSNPGTPFTVSIPENYLSPGLYIFTISFTNWFGKTYSATAQVTKSSPSLAPTVSIYSIPSNPAAGAGLNIYLNVSTCSGPVQEFDVAWRGTGIDSNNRNEKAIYLPAFTLIPNNSYIFTASVNFKGSTTTSSGVLSIRTALDNIVANAGSSFSTGTLAPTIIIAPIIIDDSYRMQTDLQPPYPSATFSCSWTCTNSSGNLCKDSLNQNITIPNDCSAYDLKKKYKLIAGTYKFEVTVINTITQVSTIGDPAVVTIFEGLVPTATFIASDLNPGINSAFSIQASPLADSISSNTQIKDLIYQWTAQTSCNGQTYTGINLETGVTLSTSLTSQNLKFIPGSLQPDSSYCFQLTITDPNLTNPGVSSISIKTRKVPFGGNCNINTISGRAFSDVFTFNCSGWSTDPKSSLSPLIYNFYIRRKGSLGEATPLQSSMEASMSTKLASGTFELSVQIMDSAGSTNLIPQIQVVDVTNLPVKRNIGIQKRSLDHTAAILFLQTSIQSFFNSSNVQNALKDIGVGISDLPSGGDSTTSSNLVSQVLTNFNVVFSSGLWTLNADDQSASQAAGILAQVVGTNFQFNSSLADTIFTTVQSVVDAINKTSPSTCYSSKTANQFGSALDAAISSASNSGYYSSVMVEKFSVLLEIISVCVQRGQICGQSPFSYAGTGLDFQSGLSYAFESAQYCDFSVAGFDSAQISKCYAFQCSSTVNAFYPPQNVTDSLYVATNENLTIFPSERIIGVQLTFNSVIFPIIDPLTMTGKSTLPQDFVDFFSLTGFTESAQINFKYSPKTILVKPVFGSSPPNFEYLGNVSSISNDIAQFNSPSLGSYLVGVKMNDAYNPPIVTQTTTEASPTSAPNVYPDHTSTISAAPNNSITMTIVAAFVAFVVVLIIGGLGYYLWTLREKKRKRAAAESKNAAIAPLAPTSQNTAPLAEVVVNQSLFKSPTVKNQALQNHVLHDPNPNITLSDAEKHQRYYDYITDHYAQHTSLKGESQASSSLNPDKFKDYHVPLDFDQFCYKMDNEGWKPTNKQRNSVLPPARVF